MHLLEFHITSTSIIYTTWKLFGTLCLLDLGQMGAWTASRGEGSLGILASRADRKISMELSKNIPKNGRTYLGSGCFFFILILKRSYIFTLPLMTRFLGPAFFFGVDENLRNPGIHHQYTDVCVIAKKSCGYIKESWEISHPASLYQYSYMLGYPPSQ